MAFDWNFTFFLLFLSEIWYSRKPHFIIILTTSENRPETFPGLFLFFKRNTERYCWVAKDSSNLVRLLTNIRTEMASRMTPNNLRST